MKNSGTITHIYILTIQKDHLTLSIVIPRWKDKRKKEMSDETTVIVRT